MLQKEQLFNKALAALNRGNAKGAKKSALKLTKIDQGNFSAWHLMAAIHGELGEIALAEKAFVRAAGLAATVQDRSQVYEQLGKFLMEKQQPGKAARYFTRLQELAPDRAEVWYFLAEAHRFSRQYPLAIDEYDRSTDISGPRPEILLRKADCLRKMGEPEKAIDCLIQIPVADPVNVQVTSALVACYVEIDAFDDAECLLQKTVEIDPENSYLHYELALLYRNFGKLSDAARSFEKALALEPDAATVYYNYSRIKRFEADDPVIEAMQHSLARLPEKEETDGQLRDKTELLFALGKIAEDCEKYDEAFDYWQRANALKRRTFDYRIADDKKRVAAIRKVFNTDLIGRLQLESCGRPIPIFIVGLPRAGSTLCEQIISSHSEVHGMGELTLLPELLGEFETSTGQLFPQVMRQLDRSQLQALRDGYMAFVSARTDQRYFTDKLPGNLWLIGLAKILFPEALFIHAYRDPIDTGFSCFKHLFSGSQKFAYDLAEIGQYIELYRELMSFWHDLLPGSIFDLEYESLVVNPESNIESLLSYCDLPWQQECLDFRKTRRAVQSSSAAQIRQPLYKSAIGFWRHYEGQLQELTRLN